MDKFKRILFVFSVVTGDGNVSKINEFLVAAVISLIIATHQHQ